MEEISTLVKQNKQTHAHTHTHTKKKRSKQFKSVEKSI